MLCLPATEQANGLPDIFTFDRGRQLLSLNRHFCHLNRSCKSRRCCCLRRSPHCSMERQVITAEGNRICDKEIWSRAANMWRGCRCPASFTIPSKYICVGLDLCKKHAAV